MTTSGAEGNREAVKGTTEQKITVAHDLAAQVSRVHFTLLIVTLALLAASLQPRNRPLLQAFEDSVAIKLLSEMQDELLKGIEDAADRASRATPGIHNIDGMALGLGDGTLVGLSFGRPWLYTPSPENARIQSIMPDVGWQNLKDFQEFWDAPHTFVLIPPIPLEGSADCGGGQTVDFKLVSVESPVVVHDLRYGLVEEGVVISISSDLLLDAPVLGAGDLPVHCTLTTQVADVLDVNVRAIARAHAGKDQAWLLEDFETSFSDLEEMTTNLRSLSFRDLVEELETRSKRESGQLEVFGAKLPADSISTIGALILLGCQFYFWIHLSELMKRLSSLERDTWPAFAGLYDDPYARGFTVVSATILPVCVLLWASIRAPLDSWYGRAAQVLFLTLSLLFAALAMRPLARARRLEQSS